MGGNLRGGYSFLAGSTEITRLITAAYIAIGNLTPTKAGLTFTSNMNGVIRVTFDLWCNGGSGQTVYAQIYKNGAANGTLRSTTNNGASPVTFTEDIVVTPGSTVDIRAWATNGSYAAMVAVGKITIQNATFSVA